MRKVFVLFILFVFIFPSLSQANSAAHFIGTGSNTGAVNFVVAQPDQVIEADRRSNWDAYRGCLRSCNPPCKKEAAQEMLSAIATTVASSPLPNRLSAALSVSQNILENVTNDLALKSKCRLCIEGCQPYWRTYLAEIKSKQAKAFREPQQLYAPRKATPAKAYLVEGPKTGNRRIYFFKGDSYQRYNTEPEGPDTTEPREVTENNWPGLPWELRNTKIRTGVRLSENYARFFTEDGREIIYYYHNKTGWKVLGHDVTSTVWNLPADWENSVDAAVNLKGYIFLFHNRKNGSAEYMQFAHDGHGMTHIVKSATAIDALESPFRGLVSSRIDAVINWDNDRIFFLHGTTYSRMRANTGIFDQAQTATINGGFSGLRLTHGGFNFDIY